MAKYSIRQGNHQDRKHKQAVFPLWLQSKGDESDKILLRLKIKKGT